MTAPKVGDIVVFNGESNVPVWQRRRESGQRYLVTRIDRHVEAYPLDPFIVEADTFRDFSIGAEAEHWTVVERASYTPVVST